MLKCISRYRNGALRMFVEPGEVLRDLSPAEEDYLLRDSPGSFELMEWESDGRIAPAATVQQTREKATRDESERGRGSVISRAFAGAAEPPAAAEPPSVGAPRRGRGASGAE